MARLEPTERGARVAKTGKGFLKFALLLLSIFAVGMAVWKFVWLPGQTRTTASRIQEVANLPTDGGTAPAVVQVPKLPLPSERVAQLPTDAVDCVRADIMAWQSQTAWIYANGGARTTEGSLMQRHGAFMEIRREDDVEVMKRSLMALAQDMHNGNANPCNRVKFVAIMGDGSAPFLESVNSQLTRLGDQYRAEVIGSAGYSVGEDKCMGPSSWKNNPRLAIGKTISAYIPDGDWAICMRWASANDIPVNPDYRTYDPNALNWFFADDFIKAAQMYNAGTCENRPESINGHATGKTTQVCVDGVATWTPGDINVARGRGGLVSLLSTKEQRWQMPNTIIGIRAWNQANKKQVSGMLAGMFEGADQFRNYPDVREKAFELNSTIFGEDAEYWKKYFTIQQERDAQGLMVEVGGSAVNGLADNLHLYGLPPYKTSLYRATYETFGDVVVEQYPDQFSTYPRYEDIFDPTYVLDAQAILARMGSESANTTVAPQSFGGFQGEFTSEVGTSAVSIEFAVGKVEPTPDGLVALRTLAQTIATSQLAVRLGCHTDDVGAEEANLTLSEGRCAWVKNWMVQNDPSNFPSARIVTQAFGETRPKQEGMSVEARRANRRVEVTLGTTR